MRGLQKFNPFNYRALLLFIYLQLRAPAMSRIRVVMSLRWRRVAKATVMPQADNYEYTHTICTRTHVLKYIYCAHIRPAHSHPTIKSGSSTKVTISNIICIFAKQKKSTCRVDCCFSGVYEIQLFTITEWKWRIFQLDNYYILGHCFELCCEASYSWSYRVESRAKTHS